MASAECPQYWKNRINRLGKNRSLCPVTVRLLNMITHTGFDLIQFNNLRILARPETLRDVHMEKFPNKDFELFVVGIPNDMFEDELVPYFSKYGKLFEIRLLMNGNKNAGFCYVKYWKKEAARSAMDSSRDCQFKIRGHALSLFWPRKDTRIMVSNVPHEMSKIELLTLISDLNICGITDVNAPPESVKRTRDRRKKFCFLDFCSQTNVRNALHIFKGAKPIYLKRKLLQFQAVFEKGVTVPCFPVELEHTASRGVEENQPEGAENATAQIENPTFVETAIRKEVDAEIVDQIIRSILPPEDNVFDNFDTIGVWEYGVLQTTERISSGTDALKKENWDKADFGTNFAKGGNVPEQLGVCGPNNINLRMDENEDVAMWNCGNEYVESRTFYRSQ